jgi:hypothetical protein
MQQPLDDRRFDLGFARGARIDSHAAGQTIVTVSELHGTVPEGD